MRQRLTLPSDMIGASLVFPVEFLDCPAFCAALCFFACELAAVSAAFRCKESVSSVFMHQDLFHAICQDLIGVAEESCSQLLTQLLCMSI